MITDDHPIYRQAAAAALQCQEEIIVVGLCSSGPEALEKIPEHLPDIVLMDIRMHPMDGIETYPTDQPTIVPVIYASFAEAVVRYCW
mgnify:CR=1 FL=1